MFTDAAGYGAVPLGEGVGHRQALDGTGALQHVAGAALEADHGAHREVVARAAAMPGLRHRTALRGAGPWNGWGTHRHTNTHTHTNKLHVHSSLPSTDDTLSHTHTPLCTNKNTQTFIL